MKLSAEDWPSKRQGGRRRFLLLAATWLPVVILFASQWHFYDAAHGASSPFLFYLGWSFYLWGLLTPLALWLAWRFPVTTDTWLWVLPLHAFLSLALTTSQLCIEAWVAWLRLGADGPLSTMVWHYLRQHIQIGVLTYWMLLGAAQFYRLLDQMRKRQLLAAQLEARLAEAQIENLRTQLNPHFLFNTLQAVATLIHENPGAAEEMVLRLSELLRVSLDEMRTQEISLAREIEFLEHYMAIQQQRFGERLQFEVRMDPGVLRCAVPTLVLQPLVENAIRHGISKHKKRDVVTIRAWEDQEQLRLEVANLSSTLEGTTEQLLSRGIGLSNTRKRLEQLYEADQSLILSNLEPVGVSVRLAIPLRRAPVDQPAVAAP